MNRSEKNKIGRTEKATSRLSDRMALKLFILSCAALIFFGGMTVGVTKCFPYGCFQFAYLGFKDAYNRFAPPEKKLDALYFWKTKFPNRPVLINTDRAYPGVNLVTGIDADSMLFAKIIDMDGRTLHEWDLDWFKIWPDVTHIPKDRIPRERPGCHIHGAVIMENGDLIFNYEHKGLVRIAPDGEVIWRLPRLTHHSIHRDDDGNLWVCGGKEHNTRDPRMPNRKPLFGEYTILKVSPDGKILREWSMPDLLAKNGYEGLCYLGKQEHVCRPVSDDLLHLNDIEPFPETMKEGFFKKGDVMVSLRNVNTIFVFNRETDKIKYIVTGQTVWQHDPDFIDGDSFSVFDNYAVKFQKRNRFSRIAIIHAPDGQTKPYYQGSAERPFYSDIMGKHQWLPNGNLLITEARQGRAFEINRKGEIVWQYVHYVGEGTCGLMEEVQRLPPEYARLYDRSTAGRHGSADTAINR